MLRRRPLALVALSILALLVAASPRPARAGVGDLAMSLAGPLAEQFGVPAGAVTGLLESGISLDSVTQLLLVSQSSGTDLGAVTKLFNDSGNDLAKTAAELNVDPSAYSEEKVTAAIDAAKQKATADAKDQAGEEAGKALDSAIGGLTD